MEKKDPLYILDTSALIYRSHYAFAKSPLTNTNGVEVSAIYGFFKSLYTVFDAFQPRLFAAALDSRAATFRHEMYSDYKATRPMTPPELSRQIPVIEEIAGAFGLPLLRYDGFEADDVIASLVTQCKAENRPAVIISSDKDLAQLLDEHVIMLKQDYSSGWNRFTADDAEKRWGVRPSALLDFLSLVGDTADNVPGVSGIGKTRAAKLIQQFGSLDGIYAHIDELKGFVKRSIIDGKENAYFSRKLIDLVRDIPIEGMPSRYDCTQLNWHNAAALFVREEMPSLARIYSPQDKSSIHVQGGKNTRTKSPLNQTEEYARTVSPLEEFIRPAGFKPASHDGVYVCVTDADILHTIIDEAIQQGFVAFDTETTGLNSFTSALVGFSLSLKKGSGYYIPVRGPAPELDSEPHPCMPLDAARAALQRLVTAPVTLIMHNAKFDIHVLQANGITVPDSSALFDTIIACWLLEPARYAFSLDSLAGDLLGIQTLLYKDVVPKGAGFQDVDVETATRYAGEDADITLQLYELLKPKLDAYNLSGLFYNLEMPLVFLLAKMERSGIFLKTSALLEFAAELEKELRACEHSIFDIVGHEFNIASPKQLQEVLFNERKLTPGKKTKTGYSTDTGVLHNLASEDVIPGKILDYRAMAKLKSTYADALPALVHSDGRVRTSFVQTGTATGRLSSRDPNLQNIPIRDEAGRRIRRAFCAAEGNTLISADYAQIELVILAHLSQDVNLVASFVEGIDVHAKTAALIFGVDIDAVQPDMRRIAKTINFGVMYGMSAFRLANELRIPRSQAAGFIDAYFATYAGVKQYMDGVKAHAAKYGSVETLMGRRRSIPAIYSRNKNERAAAERVAINTPIQGTAADIVKTAMLHIDDAMKKRKTAGNLLLQVHDELIFEVPKTQTNEVVTLIRYEMEHVVDLSVPLRVSIETGTNWGDFH